MPSYTASLAILRTNALQLATAARLTEHPPLTTRVTTVYHIALLDTLPRGNSSLPLSLSQPSPTGYWTLYSYQQSTAAPPAILQFLQAHHLKQPLAQHASGLSKHYCTAHTASYRHLPTLSQLTNQSIHSTADFHELHSRSTPTHQPLLLFLQLNNSSI